MISGRILRLQPIVMAVALVAGASFKALAVTQFTKKRLPFLFDITTFTTTLSLPVTDHVDTVKMDEDHLETRLQKSDADETIEPLTILMSDDDSSIAAMAEKLALAEQEDTLADFLRKSLKSAKPLKPGQSTKTVIINKEAFPLLDKKAFTDLFSKTHHDLTVTTAEMKQDSRLRGELMRQLSPFFKKRERQALIQKILKGEPLRLDQELLPEFAKKMVRKYIVFRGPNCFHAALAFHSPQMTSSSLINVKKESGYHRAMINYDELWRAINRNFYEVNPDKMPLKYGDMLVFFDVPKEAEDDLERPVDFRWIRHTATYLFSGYTFSKGSKSPNTPYTVRTLSEEWKTWKHFTKNLGIKVFRRSQKTVKQHPPMDLADWIY